MNARRFGTQYRYGDPLNLTSGPVADFAMVAVAVLVSVQVGAVADASMEGVAATTEATLNTPIMFSPNAGISTSGGKVTDWANSGTLGAGWDLTQATAGKRPTYQATGGRSGGPAILFVAASATQLESAAATLDQPCTVVVVAKVTSEIDNMTVVEGRAGNTRRLYYASDTFFITSNGANLVNDTAGAVAVDTWYKHGAVFNGASSAARRDGTSTSGNAGAANGSGIVIGDFGTGGGGPWDGTVEWVLGWPRALSADELAAVFALLG